MKSSSARQLELDYDSSPAPSGGRHLPGSGREEGAAGSSSPSFPAFQGAGQLYAVTSRLAGRINAASVSDHEYDNLLQERQTLLDRLFSGQATRKDQIRLEYVRWSLDRIEDAKQGYVLDALESAIGTYEQFEGKLEDFKRQLEQAARRRR